MYMNMHSNEEVSGMMPVPPQFICFGFLMLQLNENWLTIEPELGDNETSTGCQTDKFTATLPFYWVLVFFMLDFAYLYGF
jgi:hypothetical protein